MIDKKGILVQKRGYCKVLLHAWKAKKQSLLKPSKTYNVFMAFEDQRFSKPLKNRLFFESWHELTKASSRVQYKMETEFETFRENVDSWIKQIRREFADFSDLPSVISENADNIQHNYELIYELKDEIEELKQEVNALKLIQIISLKQKMNQKVEEQKA